MFLSKLDVYWLLCFAIFYANCVLKTADLKQNSKFTTGHKETISSTQRQKNIYNIGNPNRAMGSPSELKYHFVCKEDARKFFYVYENVVMKNKTEEEKADRSPIWSPIWMLKHLSTISTISQRTTPRLRSLSHYRRWRQYCWRSSRPRRQKQKLWRKQWTFCGRVVMSRNSL